MSGVGVIHGVDDTLKRVAKLAVQSMSTVPEVTVGPLKSQSTALRLNWFLYRIDPHPAYRNMEPPATGWKTARGRPPLALQLHYLLTAFPGGQPADGDQEQFSHAAIAAVMRALHSNPIIGNDDPALSPKAKPLVEPLRITLDPLDLEALSKIWTAASEAMRLSVGYEVTLVVIDSPERHAAGPPVRSRRVAVAPTMGPRLLSASPPRVSANVDVRIEAAGLTGGAIFTLARETADPAGSGDWAMTLVRREPPNAVVLRLPNAGIAPGARQLGVATTDSGLPIGRDSLALTVAPAVTGPTAAVAAGAAVTLSTLHAAPDVEVFLGGKQLPANSVTYASPTQVGITIPPATPAGPVEVALRANKVAGPPFRLQVGP